MRLSSSRITALTHRPQQDFVLWDKAGTRPSLDLQFADRKDLVDAISGQQLITHTRASSGTYVGSDGLIKTATTNLLTYSEDFENVAWQTTNPGEITLITGVADPAGGSNATTFYHDSGAGDTGFLRRIVSGTSGQPYTLSLWARRRAGSGKLFVTLGDNIAQEATDVTSTWKRFSFNNTPTSSSVRTYIKVDSPGDQFDIWGAQLEQSTTVGEYIPTTSTINSAPRFDHDPTTGESLGLLVEESRTNSIRNNTMVGAVAGTPGTLPTNWSGAGSAFGLTREIVGTGIDNGINYFDIRLSGTASSNYVAFYAAEASNAISAAQNDVWTFSVYAKLQSGSLSGVSSILLRLDEINSSLVFISGAAEAITPTSANLIEQRATVTKTFSDPSVAYAFSGIRIQINSGSTVDFTLRIGLPQLEKGAFATSVIPTSTATVTRAADVASISGSNFSSWFNASDGSIFNDSRIIKSSTQTQVAYHLDGTNYDISLRQPHQTADQFRANIGNVFTASPGTGGALSGGATKAVVAYSGTAGRLQVGSLGDNVTMAGTLDANQLFIGSLGLGTQLNGTLKRLTYWPQRLPDATLQNITT